MVLEAPQGWTLNADGTRLERTFAFDTHQRAAQFVQQVAVLSDTLDHHPEITLSWRSCRIVSWSHDHGGVTQRDLALAERVNLLWQTAHDAQG